MDHKIAQNIFIHYLRIGRLSKAMDIYHSQQMKARQNMSAVLFLIDYVRKSKKGDTDMDMSHIVTVLEDHLAVAEACLEMKDTHEFYSCLAIAYKDLNQYENSGKWFKKQLEIARALKDEKMQLAALMDLSLNYRIMGDHDQAIDTLNEGYEISYRGQCDNMGRALVCCGLGMSMRLRSISSRKSVPLKDHVEILQMHKKAFTLAMDAIDGGKIVDFVALADVSMFLWNISRSLCGLGQYDEGIRFARYSIKFIDNVNESMEQKQVMCSNELEWFRTSLATSRSKALLNVGRIYLQKFYHLKSLGEPFLESELLQDAEPFVNQAYEGLPRSHIDLELYIIAAQVHYFLHVIGASYLFLVRYLDTQISSGRKWCGCCAQESGVNAVTKRCSGCKSTYYCSSTCQTLHWKTDVAGEVRHKDLCPLIKYWRKKWKRELKDKSRINRETTGTCIRWANVEEMNEHLTDTCRAKFKQFFSSLLEKEKKEESYIPTSSIADVD